MYIRLARREEREVESEFGDTYRRYAATTPAFFPGLALAKTRMLTGARLLNGKKFQ